MRKLQFLTPFLLSLLSCAVSFGQDKSFAITISPTFLSFRTITLQPGLEYYFADRWAAAAQFCFASPPDARTGFEKVKLFRTNFEIKRFGSRTSNTGYVSLNTSYFTREIVAPDSGEVYLKNNNAAMFYDANIRSNILSFAIKFGREISVGQRLFLDVYLGLGDRVIFTRYDAARMSPLTQPYRRGRIAPVPSYMYNYTIHRFHCPVGLGAGWRL
jgi:hypothetical protein